MPVAFILVALALPWAGAGALLLAQRRRRRFRDRLLRAATSHLPDPETDTAAGDERLEAFSWITTLLRQAGLYDRIDLLLRRADLPLTPGEYVACVGTLWTATPVTVWLLGYSGWIVAAVAAVVVAVPRTAFGIRHAMRRKRFTEQLPDALDMISSSLRVGHGLQRALQLIAAQSEPPLAAEFRQALSEVALGSGVDTALQRIADRLDSKEMDLLANVVSIQLQVGGNLAEIIDRVAETIREREELQNEVKSLTAEGKMTAMVCMAMPPAMGLFEAWVNPDYMAPLIETPTGLGLLGGMGMLQLFGALIIKRMMKLEA